MTRTLDLGDGVTLELVRIPGGRFVDGLDRRAAAHERPAVGSTLRRFWMAVAKPPTASSSSSGPTTKAAPKIAMGYQFGVLGYDQDQPDQPAVRVVLARGHAISAAGSRSRTGLAVVPAHRSPMGMGLPRRHRHPLLVRRLPTPTIRPSPTSATRRLAEFAADTALDNYTAARPMVNPNRYDDWIPRDDRFNDGGFVTEPVGQLPAQPLGPARPARQRLGMDPLDSPRLPLRRNRRPK